MIAPETALAELERHGPTDVGYLRLHFSRFTTTKALLEATWPRKGGRVLDIGAHWLHQSYLYACDGYEVSAADMPSILDLSAVRDLARAHGIRLLPYDDLAGGHAFAAIPDNSFDIILFTEILEHLAFNPVALWRELHRILSPGGRIVLTTPNFLALRALLRRWKASVTRSGGGLSVEDILRTPTYGHHWKEYSLAELREYFSILSSDFVVRRALHVEDYYGSPSLAARCARAVETMIPPLRPHLHVEVELAGKRNGVMKEPAWS
jgi:2-polyprenyl-6-hydroxyphenyl methylase/3-demethylubiquinone-9 3-methyltransferase